MLCISWKSYAESPQVHRKKRTFELVNKDSCFRFALELYDREHWQRRVASFPWLSPSRLCRLRRKSEPENAFHGPRARGQKEETRSAKVP